MADQNPTGSGAAVALELPADHVRFLRGVFEKARAGIGDELEEFPHQLDPKRLEREHIAYGRLLTALDELVIVPAHVTEELARSTPWEQVGPGIVFVPVPESKGSQVTVALAASVAGAG